jgi:hypothetical protein
MYAVKGKRHLECRWWLTSLLSLFSPRKEPWYPLNKGAGLAPELVWMLWRKKNLFPSGIRILDCQPVAQLVC